MANTNFRDLFPFDDPGSTNSAPGGLPGLLRQVTLEWRPKPGLLDADPASLMLQPGRAFAGQQLQALARRGLLTQPLSSDPADVDTAASRDPNFRQLISRPQEAIKRMPGDEHPATPDKSSRLALNVTPPRFDSEDLHSPKNDAGATNLVLVGSYSNPFSEGRWWQPVSPWPRPRDEDVAAMWKAIRHGWENLKYHLTPNATMPSDYVPPPQVCIRSGLGPTPGQSIWQSLRDEDAKTYDDAIGPFHRPNNPIMPQGPASIPRVSSPNDLTLESPADRFPAISWRVTAPAVDEPSAECKEKIRRARDQCAEGFANDWRGTPHLGPYKNPDGRLWDTNDCVRGIVEEECRPQGNPVDRPPPPKVKRLNLRPRRKKKTSAYDMETDEASV